MEDSLKWNQTDGREIFSETLTIIQSVEDVSQSKRMLIDRVPI